ncbi:MAG TPA: MBL fold metallo-hydrolase [Chlamydiales bacterium]|nr:MBL fold metallo-hydrolase [Chlamydiales bacterium]
MLLEKFPCGPIETNAYLIGCDQEKVAAAIDPSFGSSELLISFCKKHSLRLESVFLTHSHWDHIADVPALIRELEKPPLIWIHPLDAPNLEHPGSDGLPMLFEVEGAKPDRFFEDGQEIYLGKILIKIIHTPGHSPGGVVLYLPNEKILISGDTLFQGSMGNISFPTSNPEDMWESLKKLSKLPPETRVCPGHGPDTTIGKEGWIRNAKELFMR